MAPPLYGLVLAGGRSTRMQRDKAALSYQGRNQLDRAMDLLGSCVQQAFVSVRADQRSDPARARYPQVLDACDGLGPIAGIAAAQALQPDAAWLVLACDLPFLEARVLQFLIAASRSGAQSPPPFVPIRAGAMRDSRNRCAPSTSRTPPPPCVPTSTPAGTVRASS